MRDFLDYIQKSKDTSPTSIDFYIESLAQSIKPLQELGLDSVKMLVLGYMIGKNIDIKSNAGQIKRLLNSNVDMNSNLVSGFITGTGDSLQEIGEKHEIIMTLESKLKELTTVIKNLKNENQPELISSE